MRNILIAVNGFLMALADSVPGVSGGTIAFLMGIYDEFITSLSDIFGRDNQKRKRAIIFLVKLGIGWVIGFAGAVTVLSALFTEKIYFISSVFLGFIIFSIPIVVKEEKAALTKKYSASVFLILGVALVAALTILNSSDSLALDLAAPDVFDSVILIICGMAAVSAMVLPGISGSTIMLIFGVYVPIINAVKGFLSLDFSGIQIIIPVLVGIILGVLLVIRLIKSALEKHRSASVYFIIGMMIASLYAIVCGPQTLDDPQPMMTLDTFSILGFLIGAVIIVGLQLLKNRLEKVRNC